MYISYLCYNKYGSDILQKLKKENTQKPERKNFAKYLFFACGKIEHVYSLQTEIYLFSKRII